MERRVLVLRRGGHLAVHLGRGCLVETDLGIADADRLEHVKRADSGDLRGGHRLLERDRHEALRGQVVYFLRLVLVQQPNTRAGVGNVVLHQLQVLMAFDAELGQAPEVHRAGAPKSADYTVTQAEQVFGEVSAVLPSDSRNECGFRHYWNTSADCRRGAARSFSFTNGSPVSGQWMPSAGSFHRIVRS